MKTIVNLSFILVSVLLLTTSSCCTECGGGSRGLFPVWKTAGSRESSSAGPGRFPALRVCEHL